MRIEFVSACGQLAKPIPHFLRALQIELVGFRFETFGIAQGRVGLDADQELLSRRIRLIAVVDIVRDHHWQVERLGQ